VSIGETRRLARNAVVHAAKSGLGMIDATDATAIVHTASKEFCDRLRTLKSALKQAADGAPGAPSARRAKRVEFSKAMPDTQHERMVEVALRLPA